MNEQKNNGRGIFYGVVGVATLVVAVIGATFAYFTSTATGGANEIKGDMATVKFGVTVSKVTHYDESNGGMIPMSNNMADLAVNDATNSSKKVCVDDNGNAVCQVYKITVTNEGSAALFVDGYVSLYNGSGYPTDLPADYYTTEGATAGAKKLKSTVLNPTTMRWAQVGCSGTASESDAAAAGVNTGDAKTCSTTLASTTGAIAGNIALADPDDSFSSNNIKVAKAAVVGNGTIYGNTYDVINTNYVRISNHTKTEKSYDRDNDVTSALVYNQPLAMVGEDGASKDFYVVVWLSETGTNQTPASSGAGAATSANNFFNGLVTFISAQGSEVTATFTSYNAPTSDTTANFAGDKVTGTKAATPAPTEPEEP